MNLIKKFPTATIAAVYFILTLVLTFPLAFKFGSEVPRGGGDVFNAIARIESQTSLMREQGFFRGLINLVTTYQFNTFSPYVLPGFFSSAIISYNILFVLSFALSALGAYLLAYYFTKNRAASFLAGIIFAFAPFHFYQATSVHLGTMHQEWIPFFILFLFKFFDSLKFKYFCLTVLFFILIAITEHQLLAFTVIFVIFFITFKFVVNPNILKNRIFWIYALATASLMIMIAIFLFAPLIKIATSSENYLNPGIGKAAKYSMGLLDPLVPPAFHSVWPNVSIAIQKIIPGGSERGSYFIGFSVFACILYGFWIKKKYYSENNLQTQASVYFWLIEVAVFFIASLGPYFSVFGKKIYLPYYLIYKFAPFYENIRTTGRFFVYAMLGVSILFALAFSVLLKKYDKKKIACTAVFCIIILIEFLTFPLKTMPLAYSPLYDKIGKEKESYNLLEIPGSTNYNFANYAAYTAIMHKKNMINGMPIARKIKGQFKMQRTTPIIKQLLYTLPKGNNPEKKNPPEYFANANQILNQYNIRYITISKKYVKEKILINAKSFIEKYIKYDEKYEDNYLVAYKITSLIHK